MEIEDLNPWWKNGRIDEELQRMERRDLFFEILKYLNDRQILSIVGLRRVGKTVLLHHIIDSLLKNIEKEKILYYNFDLLEDISIEEILSQYGDIVNVNFKKDKIFIFLDEIQKHKGWEEEIKLLYDNYKNIKLLIAGSSSLLIEKKTKESLAGRTYSFEIGPLSFKEYLKLKRIKYEENKLQLYKDEINSELKHYIKTGGFPELMNEKDEVKIKKYIKELIVDRLVYIDIPEVFDVDEPELLVKLISIISAKPGMIFDYDSVASDLNRNRKTISKYVFYLEKAFLIKKIYNFSKNLLTSEKKLKKIYPSTVGLAFLYGADVGSSIETTILQNIEARFFYKKKDKEIDFISNFPVEIKYQEKINIQDLKPIIEFMDLFNFKKGIVVTKNIEKEEKIKEKRIILTPLWKFLLKKEGILL